MRVRIGGWGMVAGLLLQASLAQAQIVNVLGNVKEVEDGLSGQMGVSFGFKAGNTNVVQAKGDLAASYKLDQHLVYLIARVEFGTSQPIDKLSWDSFDKDFVYIARVFEHLRYRYTIFDWLMAEAFAQHEADRFRDLGTRVLLGVGPRFRWQPFDQMALAVGTAYMFEHERYNSSLLESATSHRSSSYTQVDLVLNETFSLHNTTFLQPRLAGDRPVVTETGDVVISHFRLYSDSSLVLKVTGWLAIKVAFRVMYNSTTPPQPEDLTPVDNRVVLVDEDARKVKQLDTSLDTTFMFTW